MEAIGEGIRYILIAILVGIGLFIISLGINPVMNSEMRFLDGFAVIGFFFVIACIPFAFAMQIWND